MRKVPMAALAAPVFKPGLFQVGNQLSHFARHFSIKIVSRRACRCQIRLTAFWLREVQELPPCSTSLYPSKAKTANSVCFRAVRGRECCKSVFLPTAFDGVSATVRADRPFAEIRQRSSLVGMSEADLPFSNAHSFFAASSCRRLLMQAFF